MSILNKQPLSRRSAIAVMFSSCAMLRPGSVAANQVKRPAPVDLGHGLEIRDYRLFPTEDVKRFIVEIHNTTDTAVDTPTIGVVLPQLGGDNFGWANPVSPVLHPHSSECLIGVAPVAVENDEDWDSSEWMLCDAVTSVVAEDLSKWDFEIEHRTEILNPTHARTVAEVTNLSDSRSWNLRLQGLVRDGNKRVCGALVTASLAYVFPGETSELTINLIPTLEYVANPFNLIDSVEDVEISFTLQAPSDPANPNCSTIMPWN